jgi:OmpA-OmpF porin, OOP family
MKLFTILTIVLLTASSHAADTYDLTGRWGVGLGAGMTSVTGPDEFTEGLTELDSKFAASVWLRYHMTSRLGVELAYSRLMYEFIDTNSPMSEMDPTNGIVDLSLAYRMFPTKAYHVLIQAGLGWVRYSDFDIANTDDKRDDLAIKGRIGFEYMATPDLMLALQADYYRLNYGSDTPDNMDVWAPMLGITYYFGSSGKKADLDGDGVADDNDKCPGTTAGTPVGVDGCPVKVDTDGDGIVDTEDQCPGTPAGQVVTAFGCAKTEKLEITLNVQFASGKSAIDEKYTADLEKFAEFLTKYPETKAEIEGHTDNTGAEKQNYRISQKRAEAVSKYLVDKYKIDKTRLTAKGYGPSQPVADNTTPEGRDKNRRVVAHVKTDK